MRCTTCKLRYTGYAALRLARTLWRHVQDRAETEPARLTVAIQLANLLAEQGEFSEAAGMYRDTLEVRRRVLGAEHPNTLTSASNFARVLGQQRELPEAARVHRACSARSTRTR